MNLESELLLDTHNEVRRSWNQAPTDVRTLLRALAELGRAPVPCRLLLRMKLFGEQVNQDSRLEDTLRKLSQLELLHRDQAGDPWITSTVRAFVLGVTPDTERLRQMVGEAVVHDMKRCRNGCDAEVNKQLEKVIPHAADLIIREKLPAAVASELCDSLAKYHWDNEQYARGITFLRQAVAKTIEAFEPNHPSIAVSEANLAVGLERLGHLEEAESLLRRVLRSAQHNFDPGHPTIATAQSNLALVLHDLGQLEEARDLLRQVVVMDEKNYEHHHPARSDSVRHLALVLRDLGETEQARELLLDAHLSLVRALGREHPKTQLVAAALQSLPGD